MKNLLLQLADSNIAHQSQVNEFAVPCHTDDGASTSLPCLDTHLMLVWSSILPCCRLKARRVSPPQPVVVHVSASPFLLVPFFVGVVDSTDARQD